MPAKTWNVWSIDDAKDRALVVDEGAEHYAKASAERRNRAAEKFEVAIRFEALPEDEVPTRRESPDGPYSSEEESGND